MRAGDYRCPLHTSSIAVGRFSSPRLTPTSGYVPNLRKFLIFCAGCIDNSISAITDRDVLQTIAIHSVTVTGLNQEIILERTPVMHMLGLTHPLPVVTMVMRGGAVR